VAYSNVITITVNPAMTVSLSSPAGLQIGTGNPVTFTNVTQGGTPPYTYTYSVSPSTGWTQSSNPGNTFTFQVAGNYEVTLSVKDAAGSIVSSSLSITIVSPLAIENQPTSYSIDPGQTFTPLSAEAEYGTGGYTWQWYSGTPGSGSPLSGQYGSGALATLIPTQPGTYYVVFKDSSGESATSQAAVVTQNAAPVVKVSPSSATVDASQSLQLSASVSGGSGNFNYYWTIGGTTALVGTGNTYTFNEPSSGNYVIWLNVTDVGTSQPYVITPPYSVVITVKTSVTLSISPSSGIVDASQTILLSSTVSGGTGQFSYSWSVGGIATPQGSSSTYSFSQSSPNTYKIWLNVTDTGTTVPYVATATAQIVVDPSPSIAIEPSSVIIDSGQSITVTSTVSGGTGSFSWQWYGPNGAKISGDSGNGQTATATFTSAYSEVYVTFTDTGTSPQVTSAATVSSSKVSVTVDPVLSISSQPLSETIDLGQSTALSATVSGGTGQFSWALYSTLSSTPIETSTGSTATVQFSPTSNASYYFVFTDTGVSSGATPAATKETVSVPIAVYPVPTVTVNPSSATVSVNQAQVFVATVKGGTGSFAYSWTLGGSTSTLSTTNSYSFSSSSTGNFKIWVNVTDKGTSTPYGVSVSVTVQVKTGSLSVTFSTQVPSSGTGSLDLGQTLVLTVVPTIGGGLSPYTYQWFLNGTSTTNSLGSSGTATAGVPITYSFSPSGKGTFQFYLQISSKDGQSSISSPITITVYPTVAMTSQPSPATIDLGQTVTLSSKVSGGTGSFSWSLYSTGGSLVASGTGSSASFPFNPQSNASYYFTFKDTGTTAGATPTVSVTSQSVSITVNPDPTVVAPGTTIGSGSKATLTATASGGSKSGYIFKWYSNSALSNLLYTGNPFVTPALTSTTTYYVTVTDSTGTVSSAVSVTVTVVGGLTSSSLTISPTTTDTGYPIAVQVSPGSGVSPYSYSWTVTLYPSGSASGDYTTSTNEVTFTHSGVYSVTVTVRDSTGATASLTKTVTVNALPSATISPSSVTVDVGSTITFSNSTSGGTAPITYGWGYPSDVGISRSGNQFTFSNTGNFTIKLYVNDSVGASSFASATVSVNSQPIIVYSSLNVTISAAPVMDVGTSTFISINSISGTGPYTAQLKAEAPGSTTYSIIATSNQFSTLPEQISTGTLTSIGQWHFVVTVTEVSNTGIFGTSSPVTVTVVNAPSSSSLSISPTTTDVGTPVTASIQSGYGTAPFQYVWTVTTAGGGSASGNYSASGNQITFSLSGVYSVSVTVTDADGLSASLSSSITVNGQLSITISATTPTTIDKGQTVTFTNSVSGGMAPYTISYSVSSLGGGIKFGAYSINGNAITFTLPGQYVVSSIVTDSLKNTATSSNSVTVTVNALPTVTLSPSSATIDSGMNLNFTNTTSNGTKPYTFIWSYPSSQGISQSGNTFTFSDTGNFTITLTIVDAVGVVASSSSNITVNPSPIIVLHPAPSGSGNSTFPSQLALSPGLLLKEQKKTLSGGSDPSITLDEDTPWSVYVQAGTGTPPFTFTWTVLYASNSSVAKDYTLSSTNSSYVNNTITFTGTGDYAVTIKVVDKYGSTSTESLSITVNTPLLVVSATITATPTSLDLGNSTTLSSVPTISGGTPPYSYQWYRNGTSSGDKISGASGTVTSQQTLTLPQTPTVPGNYTYYLVITDSAYSPASNSTAVRVTVNNVPTTASLLISPTSTVIDGLINATMRSGYGTAPFNFTWTVTPVGSTSSSTYYGHQIALSQSGNYSVVLKVRDADGKVAYNNTTIKIYSSSLVVVKINSPTTTATIDVGQTLNVTGSFSGGSGSYKYQWVVQSSSSSSPPSSGYITGSSPQTYQFKPTSSGTFYVYLYVKDVIVGDTQSSYVEVKVNNDLTQTSISISPSTVTIGSPVSASVSAGYGTPPFTFTWTVTLINGGSASGDYSASGNQVTFSKSGNYTVKVAVSDSYSSATSSNFNVYVSAAVSLTASISTSPNAGVTAIDVSHALVLQANVQGGTGSYSYAWGLSGVSGVVGTSSTFTLNVTTPGPYLIYLNVTEGTSHASAPPVTIIVNPLPKVSLAGGSTIQADVGQVIAASVAGGTPPYQYSWTVSLYPSGAAAAGDYKTSGTTIYFIVAGNYTVKFSATDADGAVASVAATFVVNSQISSSLSLENPLSSIIDRGNSTVLNVTVSGGSGLFAYQWYEQYPGSSSFQLIPGASNSTYNFITTNRTTPGIYLFYVNITDLKTDPAYVHSNIISVTVLTTIIYAVSFSETGLPKGMKWFVNITNGPSYSATSTRISFLEPNGTYSYSVSTANKTYRLSTRSLSSFTVSGAAVNQSLVFLPVVYSVTFSEYGLTNGTEWFVNLTNGESYSSTLNVISFSLTNGTYNYTIATINKQYRPNQSSSFFVVSGNSVSQRIYFQLVTYSVTVEEKGLPAGTKWFVNLSNGQSFSSAVSSIDFYEPNGSYFYTIGTVDKIYYSNGGTFSVQGSPSLVHINFLPYQYNITFVETGLPGGTVWNVTLLGSHSNITKSSSGNIYFNEVNGTYNFTIGPISGFRTQNYLITIVINGAPFRSTITWSAVTYPVTIVETGLASGESWSVTLTTEQGGQEKTYTLNSTSNTITFNVTNGSYSYTVTLPQGYQGTPVKSTISVVGGAVTTKLRVTALPNYPLIWAISGILAIIAGVLAFYIAASRKSLFKREGRFENVGRRRTKK
jgi:hypothetical protein